MRVALQLIVWTAVLGCGGDGPQSGADPLVEAGLYEDIESERLADGVRAYEPEYALWSDGASKRRYLFLPPGARIDTSDMNGWVFPIGTRAFKEFTRDGVRVETRMMAKQDDGRWEMVAFAWNEAGTATRRVTEGATNALGTGHDVPSRDECESCHERSADVLLGVSALQLDHDRGGLDLATLEAEGSLTDPPAGPYTPPGDAATRDALGYLHANCGNCHNDGLDFNPVRLWLTVESLDRVEDTPMYRTTVDRPTEVDPPLDGTDATTVVVRGDPDASLLYVRMARRGPDSGAMPPIGTELTDDAGRAAVAELIRGL